MKLGKDRAWSSLVEGDQCDQMVKNFCSIFGHLQQIKIAKQQNLAETKIFLQMLHKHLKIGSKDLAKSGCIEGDESPSAPLGL